ncbi:DNA-invertase hin [Roseivivax jejudonensis]|uniref:DNA-invertase hin n=1 Tax=Roseivivax jejudonensis TaxID=1529041 RepID=A0A1X6Y7R4_9RHOB|nr:recombinase family protein [Roseivivax jejudonensis]SLN13484.1 DNA-invertase hin [Roseivivax jejudonensis]
MTKVRCAIYTRKSSEDGLEQEFNSLDAQREACAAFISSQKHEGWALLPDRYDDGGLSGGSLERPALQRLLEDVKTGRVDQIVVYKIDRLTRSLADFAKIVDVLDASQASFVSVTQSFNTATSMGRLTLNMLLSFAQFEREVTAERIRDKIAASKRRGLWMGGTVPIGYDPDGRTLTINEAGAATVRMLYDLYERLGSVRSVTEEAERQGLRSRKREGDDRTRAGGGVLGRGHIHHILTNPLYAGRIRHRSQVYDGQHPAIIDPDRWDRVQAQLQAEAAKPRGKAASKRQSLLCGKLTDETGDRLTPSHSKSRTGQRLRYYVSHRLVTGRAERHPDAWRLPADQLETRIASLVCGALSAPGLVPTLVPNAPADAIVNLTTKLSTVLTEAGSDDILALVERVDIAPGSLTLALDASTIAERLNLDANVIEVAPLVTSHPFQLRKRGVETRLVLGTPAVHLDRTLIRNIAKAHAWFERIKAGETFAEIAATEGTSKRRIQQLIDLAFLAPDIVRDVLAGTQPVGFTSDWCKRRTLPTDWTEQRALLATL